MRVIVCGGRDYADHGHVSRVLSRLDITELAHGGAAGADALAAWFAAANSIPVRAFRADWKQHGRAAGPLRNRRMLSEFMPDLVVAFPGGRGTDDMVRAARKAWVKVQDERTHELAAAARAEIRETTSYEGDSDE